jgi:hypothetical protein
MNINEARAKTCPIAMGIRQSKATDTDRLCMGSYCMAWVWDWDFEPMDGAVVSKTEGHCGMMPENITVEADVSN